MKQGKKKRRWWLTPSLALGAITIFAAIAFFLDANQRLLPRENSAGANTEGQDVAHATNSSPNPRVEPKTPESNLSGKDEVGGKSSSPENGADDHSLDDPEPSDAAYDPGLAPSPRPDSSVFRNVTANYPRGAGGAVAVAHSFVEGAEWRTNYESGGDPESDMYHYIAHGLPRHRRDGGVQVTAEYYELRDGTWAQSTVSPAFMEAWSAKSGEAWRVEIPSSRSRKDVTVIFPFPERDVLTVRFGLVDGTVQERIVTEMGLVNTVGPAIVRRTGRRNLIFRRFDTASVPLRATLVVDRDSKPVRDAVLLQGDAILGRSDADGKIDWRLPPESGESHARGADSDALVLWAPGYVPMMLAPAIDETPSTVILKLVETTVTIWSPGLNKDALTPDMSSDIEDTQYDLVAVSPEDSFEGWSDVAKFLWGENTRADPLHSTRPIRLEPFTGRSGRGRAGPSWGDGLSDALDLPVSSSWAFTYGRWYLRRWSYDEGTFTIALPYPGCFLLLVGEVVGGDDISHVLYVDSRDPDSLDYHMFLRP